MPYFNDDFINKIFEIAKNKRKHNVLELLVKHKNVSDNLGLADRLMLLIPDLLPI